MPGDPYYNRPPIKKYLEKTSNQASPGIFLEKTGRFFAKVPDSKPVPGTQGRKGLHFASPIPIMVSIETILTRPAFTMTTRNLKTNIGHRTAAVYRNMQHLLSNRLSSMEIKNGQYDFFYAIALAEGISQKELSEHLHIGKSTTAKAVKHLIDIGYITKRKDEKDRRIDHLFLTASGRKKAPTVAEIFHDNIRVAVKGLTRSEIDCAMAIMGRILNNLVEENGLPSAEE